MISTVASLLAAAAVVTATSSPTSSSPFPAFSGNQFQKYNLSANGIMAQFIPYGARLTNLYVHDRNGEWQDVALGYDTGEEYLQDTLTNHTNFGSLVGRYANRYVKEEAHMSHSPS
jgi:aldose 1-epimerase